MAKSKVGNKLNLEKSEVFRTNVDNKYRIFSSLFSYLPNKGVEETGMYIPLLHQLSNDGFEAGKEPVEIIEAFFKNHVRIKDPQERYDLLFSMIKYIERQVVLFDCVEEAAFGKLEMKRPIESLLRSEDAKMEEIINHLSSFGVRLVFTAHPTQFYSPNVQGIMRDLRTGIRENDVNKIETLLRQLAFTPFVNRNKPTPYDEAQSIIFYLRYVYYDAIGRLYHLITRQTGQEPEYNPSLVELGFWPGGDRDGNPFVNKDTTMEVALLLRNTVMKCYYNHVKFLRKKLTFKDTMEPLQELLDKLYIQIFQHKVSLNDQEILEIIYKVRKMVVKNYNGLFLSEINDFIGRVKVFGSHFASLDIRQDSRPHIAAIEQIFKKEFGLNYQKLSHEEKLKYLTTHSLKIKPEDYSDPLTKDTIENIYQVRTIQKNNGERGLHRYIISNSESIFDVLHVYGLFKFCGYSDAEIKIDIVPLFETMEGMNQSHEVMKHLYENPVYKAHLKRRGEAQTIMLGFSDGTKDGGYLKANWEIYRTKERLTDLSKKFGYHVIFFDGRGGPPARGGGKSHRFYAAQGSEIASERIQITIQGQTITSVFGTHEHATYNIEQLLLAGAKNLMNPEVMTAKNREIIQDLAEKSYDKYRSLKNHPNFIPYMEDMTTLKYYGATNIGSRPTKRSKSTELKLEDLRAIPFVGSWSLIRQNVPGYYGLGTALESYAGDREKVKQLFQTSAFFRVLILNSSMSMMKTYFPLTAYMKKDKKYGAFWQNLKDEYELTKSWVLYLTGQDELMENETMSKLSISRREKIVLPLLTIQQYALQMIQKNDKDQEIFKKMVVRTLFGNINASRNSA